MVSIQLQGKIFLHGTIKALTGLHIGGNSETLDIGGIDNPIIRNPLNKEPYIPGSSLRGKMRSLLDKHFNNPLFSRGSVQVHECQDPAKYTGCSVCQVFGVTPQKLKAATMPTRLIIRDSFLTNESREELEESETDSLFTEAKWEVSIDRITSEANPRQNERVPAGATFGPFQLIYAIYTLNTGNKVQIQKELDYFDTVLKGMELLEDDYLGGSGSRGSGQITFGNLTMTFKSRECYENADVDPKTIAQNKLIQDLRKSGYATDILNAINGGSTNNDENSE